MRSPTHTATGDGRLVLTANDNLGFKVRSRDPIHGFAKLGFASLICQVSCVNQDVACGESEASLRWRIAVRIGDADEPCFSTHCCCCMFLISKHFASGPVGRLD